MIFKVWLGSYLFTTLTQSARKPSSRHEKAFLAAELPLHLDGGDDDGIVDGAAAEAVDGAGTVEKYASLPSSDASDGILALRTTRAEQQDPVS